MTLRRLVLIFALSGASLYACGDDSTTTGNSPVTIAPTNGGGLDGGTTPAVSDSARPDAAVPVDSGSPRGDSGSATDSGARDSGSVTDSGKAQDSGTAAVDSGAQTTSDAGPAMTALGDPASAACLKCETTECDMKKWPNADYTFKDCAAFGTETALDGMGMGKLRRTLCEEALTCIRETRCANPLVKVGADGVQDNPDATACLCGMPYGDCLTAKSIAELKGPCRDKMADAAETNDLQTIHERLNDPEFPLGVADRHVMCSQNLCADECYAPCGSSADGAYCAGVLATLADGTAPKPGAEGTCSMKSCVDYYSVRYNGGVTR